MKYKAFYLIATKGNNINRVPKGDIILGSLFFSDDKEKIIFNPPKFVPKLVEVQDMTVKEFIKKYLSSKTPRKTLK